MARTIIVDEDVFEALQKRAEPLVDDANTVLRRLLDLGEAEVRPAISRPASEPSPRRPRKSDEARSKAKRARAPRGTLLPEEAYELPILRILGERDGRAGPASEVIDELGRRLQGSLTDADYETLQSGSVRWKNRAQFVRLKLIQGGDLKKGSPRGVWELSSQGAERISA
jgi:hypothetical protein